MGVAVSDPTGAFAQPLETLTRDRRDDTVLGRLEELVREYDVGSIVVGLPLNMDGSAGPQAQRARAFGARVARRTGLPVEFLDERWTSLEAERALGAAGSSRARRKRKRERVDPVAAALLLRTYMERRTR